MMSEETTMCQALDELSDDVLLRVLAGAGSIGISRAAVCCQRLHALAKVLQSYRCFSAAASTKSDLGDALEEACERALQGMLGCVDFVLVFAAHQRCGGSAGALPSRVVEALLPRLPPGTQLVGCCTAGLMGVGPEGAFELDPAGEERTHGSPGVALLLGRMPGCRVRAFCNLRPPPLLQPVCGLTTSEVAEGASPGRPRGRSHRRSTVGKLPPGTARREVANTAVMEWLITPGPKLEAEPELGAEQTASQLKSTTSAVLAAAAAAPPAAEDLAPDAAHEDVPGGGKTGTSSAPLESSRSGDGGGGAGRGATEVVVSSSGSALPSVGSLGLQSVWLMIAGTNAALDLVEGPTGLLQWMQADERTRPVIAGGLSSGRGDLFFHPGRKQSLSHAATAANPSATPPAKDDVATAAAAGPGIRGASATPTSAPSDWDPAIRRLMYVGLAVMAPDGVTGQGEAALTTMATAAATTVATGAGVWSAGDTGGRGLALELVPDTAAAAAAVVAIDPAKATVRACALSLRGCGGLPTFPVFQRVELNQETVKAAPDEDEDEEEQLVTVSGGIAPVGSKTLAEELVGAWRSFRPPPQLAVWVAKRGDASLKCGLNMQVLKSGKMVMGSVDPCLLAQYGIVAFHTADVVALDAILASDLAVGEVVAAQLTSITPEGCRMHLQAELPLLRSVCCPCPLLPGGRPDPHSWEGYAVVRRSALRAGARAGPVALAVFSCTGRGRTIFGDVNAENEARIADQVLQQAVPFVGAYCNGELGPYVRHGYTGWFFNPLCVQSPGEIPAPSRVASGFAASSSAAATAVTDGGVAGGRDVRYAVIAGGSRVLPLDRTRMQGYTSVYAALG